MVGVEVVVLPHGEGLPLPSRATAMASGYDLHAAVTEPVTLPPMGRALIPCGFRIAIPDGWEIQVRPRSGLAWRHGVTLINSPGTIDADYRGEVMVPLVNFGGEPFVVRRGERVAQMVFARFEVVRFEAVEALPSTARADGGFGSTGR